MQQALDGAPLERRALQARDMEALFTQAGRARVAPVTLEGRKLWLKRYRGLPYHPGRLLHWLVSPLLYPRFLKSSAMLGPKGMVSRERRKLAAFAERGFLTPEVLFCEKRTLLLGDLSETVKARLGRLNAEGKRAEREALLVRLSESLGRVHAAGLCHGRPLARDTFYHEGEIGYSDFEEEPEAVMPLADAQARDLFIQMQEIMALAKDPETPARCLAAYRAEAPEETLAALARLLRFFGLLRAPLRGFCRLSAAVTGGYVPRDLRRLEAFFVLLESAAEA